MTTPLTWLSAPGDHPHGISSTPAIGTHTEKTQTHLSPSPRQLATPHTEDAA